MTVPEDEPENTKELELVEPEIVGEDQAPIRGYRTMWGKSLREKVSGELEWKVE